MIGIGIGIGIGQGIKMEIANANATVIVVAGGEVEVEIEIEIGIEVEVGTGLGYAFAGLLAEPTRRCTSASAAGRRSQEMAIGGRRASLGRAGTIGAREARSTKEGMADDDTPVTFLVIRSRCVK